MTLATVTSTGPTAVLRIFKLLYEFYGKNSKILFQMFQTHAFVQVGTKARRYLLFLRNMLVGWKVCTYHREEGD